MKRIQKVYIIANRVVGDVGYLFRAGTCVCYNRKPTLANFGVKVNKDTQKIIECDLIIPIQPKKWRN